MANSIEEKAQSYARGRWAPDAPKKRIESERDYLAGYMAAAAVLDRFRGLKNALHRSNPDEMIIRCEVTAADLRAMLEALGDSEI